MLKITDNALIQPGRLDPMLKQIRPNLFLIILVKQSLHKL